MMRQGHVSRRAAAAWPRCPCSTPAALRTRAPPLAAALAAPPLPCVAGTGALVLQAARQEVQDKDILASQQEYRKGVSSWNFDVAVGGVGVWGTVSLVRV